PVGGVSTSYGNIARRLYTGHDFTFLFSTDFYKKNTGDQEPTLPPDGVEVRPYISGDAEGIVELKHAVYSDAGFFGSREWQSKRWLEQRTNADPEGLWVAVRGNRIIGWAEYFKWWTSKQTIDMVVEDDKDYSQICKALHTRVERAAHNNGIMELTADASYHQSKLVETLFDIGYYRAYRYAFHVAIFDLANLLERLKPLFDKELQASKFDSWPGVLRVEMDDSVAEIELEGGKKNTKICISGGYQSIVRMLCGRVGAWQGFLRNDLKITGDFDMSHQTLLNAYLGRRPWMHPARHRW
ncbi:MAG: GNAT family N-acetyltransferase, partial [Kiritimatiellae bacterium]|nr:GNAT family N-acetyltransferase [Kiritimatiellia bacterium]